jgi:hypothetical protein
VISGELYHQMEEKMDQSHGDLVHAGGFTYLPDNMPHSVWTAGEGSVVQVTGTGPFGVNTSIRPTTPASLEQFAGEGQRDRGPPRTLQGSSPADRRR